MAYEDRYRIETSNPSPNLESYPDDLDEEGDTFDVAGAEAYETGLEGEDDFPAEFETELKEANAEAGDGDPAKTDVTREEILALFNQIKAGAKPNDREVQISGQEALKILQEALRDEAAGKDAESLEGFLQVSEVFEFYPEELLGMAPTRMENGVYYFEPGEEGEDFALKAPEQGIKAIVETSGSVLIAPNDPEAPIQVTENGSYYEITVGSGAKADTFQVSNKAKIHIASDDVSGDIDNEDGNITIGSSSEKKYIPAKFFEEIADKIRNSINLVGAVNYVYKPDLPLNNGGGMSPMSLPYQNYEPQTNSKYAIGYTELGLNRMDIDYYAKEAKAEAEDVKKVLGLVGDALSESDPKKKADQWDEAAQEMARFFSQSSEGTADNRAAAFFNVIHGELGDELFKSALEEGVFPAEFVEMWVRALKADPNAITNSDVEVAWQGAGGEAKEWTHQTKADFLEKYGNSSTISGPSVDE